MLFACAKKSNQQAIVDAGWGVEERISKGRKLVSGVVRTFCLRTRRNQWGQLATWWSCVVSFFIHLLEYVNKHKHEKMVALYYY